MDEDTLGNELINELFGAAETALWIIGIIFMAYEPVKVKTAQGFSINMILMNLVSSSLQLCKNIYGYFGDSNFKHRVYWFNLVKSIITTLVYVAGFILVRAYRSRGNRYTRFGIYVPLIILSYVSLYLYFEEDVNDIMLACGAMNSVLSLLGYVPQIVLIARNKTTKGWSMTGISFLVISACIGVVQCFANYIFLKDKQNGFFAEFNLEKFSFDFFTICCCLVFYFESSMFKNLEIHRNKYLIEIETLKDAFMDANHFTKRSSVSNSFA